MSAHTNRQRFLTASHRDKERHFGRATCCPDCGFPRYRVAWTDALHCLNRSCSAYLPKPINPHRWRWVSPTTNGNEIATLGKEE